MADDNETLNAPEASGPSQPPRHFKRPHVAASDVAAGKKPFNPRTMKRPIIKMSHPAHHTPLDPHALHRPNIKVDQ